MMKLRVEHNTEEDELEIMRRITTKNSQIVNAICSVDELESIKKEMNDLHIDAEVEKYIVSLVRETRKENSQIKHGVSPRASIDLYKAAKAHAYLAGKSFVTPIDVVRMAYPVLRHRLGLSYEAKAKDILVDKVLKNIIERVEIP
jgi:MoxR-like ATPase